MLEKIGVFATKTVTFSPLCCPPNPFFSAHTGISVSVHSSPPSCSLLKSSTWPQNNTKRTEGPESGHLQGMMFAKMLDSSATASSSSNPVAPNGVPLPPIGGAAAAVSFPPNFIAGGRLIALAESAPSRSAQEEQELWAHFFPYLATAFAVYAFLSIAWILWNVHTYRRDSNNSRKGQLAGQLREKWRLLGIYERVPAAPTGGQQQLQQMHVT